jgi:hypothetical protein
MAIPDQDLRSSNAVAIPSDYCPKVTILRRPDSLTVNMVSLDISSPLIDH